MISKYPVLWYLAKSVGVVLLTFSLWGGCGYLFSMLEEKYGRAKWFDGLAALGVPVLTFVSLGLNLLIGTELSGFLFLVFWAFAMFWALGMALRR